MPDEIFKAISLDWTKIPEETRMSLVKLLTGTKKAPTTQNRRTYAHNFIPFPEFIFSNGRSIMCFQEIDGAVLIARIMLDFSYKSEITHFKTNSYKYYSFLFGQ